MKRTAALALLAVLLAAAFSSAFAQSAVVMGTVVYGNGQPAANCTVVLGSRFAFVDVRGRFRLVNVPFGTYTLQVKKQGRTLKLVPIVINQPQIALPRIVL